MVVGHDIAIGADDHTRAAALLLSLLRGVPEEEAVERIVQLVLLGHGDTDIHDSRDSGFCSIGKVRIFGFRQIDSLGYAALPCRLRRRVVILC